MFARLGDFVSRHPWWVILFWTALTVVLRLSAPAWNDVAHDGDFAYLPDDRPSVVGERLLAEAFPYHRAKSQIVVLMARRSRVLSDDDKKLVGFDLARRFRLYHGAAAFRRGKELTRRSQQAAVGGDADMAATLQKQSQAAFDAALDALEDAIQLDKNLADFAQRRRETNENDQRVESPRRLAEAYHNVALVNAYLGNHEESDEDRRRALSFDRTLEKMQGRLAPEGVGDWPLLDVWSWHDLTFGKKLVSRDHHAQLIVLQIDNEFMAADNIRVLQMVEAELEDVRHTTRAYVEPGLTIGISGSAAVGGDLLRSAQRSIANTEWFTVVLVVTILALVYRSPLLISVPVATITVSLIVATNLVALLSQWTASTGISWWEVKVFTTTKIFIVVILFGAGTDFCLFLISRYREELEDCVDHAQSIAKALAAVGQALAASALTTIVGLSMMYFADFGKFRHSGPVIGLCLAITLAACVTLAPALLQVLGGLAFWPFGLTGGSDHSSRLAGASRNRAVRRTGRFGSVWRTLARTVTAYPERVLILSVLVLAPLAYFGFQHAGDVTYDFLNALSPACPSRQGTEILTRHFPIGESGPLTVLVQKTNGRLDTDRGEQAIRELTKQLHKVKGVLAVRSIDDPLGNAPQNGRRSIFGNDWLNWLARAQKRTAAIYIAQNPSLAGTVTRFELILEPDPFSVEAAESLSRIDRMLHESAQQPGSYWQRSTFSFAGTTAAIRDLREVTRSDNLRIEILVVLAVFVVLLAILRRPLICLYMILSVLFTYFVTLGAITLFFAWAYGASYQGLDWKVPLFLFVILVAIGQDYNVYLATRVFEEQRRLGMMRGLRQAIVRTGGIITSCGVIMAGTFISMTSGTWGNLLPRWLPYHESLFPTDGTLRGMVELGLALALGVLLDTFIVRPIMVPAFLAMSSRWGIAFSAAARKTAGRVKRTASVRS